MVILRIVDLGLDVEVPSTTPETGPTITASTTNLNDENALTQTEQDINAEMKVKWVATDWNVATDLSFSDVILKSEGDKDNLSSIVFNEVLDPNKTYYARARVLLETGYTVWGNIDVIVPDVVDATNELVDVPGLVSVPLLSTNSPQLNHTPVMFTITADGFMTTSSAVLTSVSWFIEELDGNVIWSKLNDTVNKTSIEVNDVVLKPSEVYRIKAMFHTTSNDTSAISSLIIQVTDNDNIILLTYIDLVDSTADLPLEIRKIDVVTDVTYEIISLKDNYAQSVYKQTVSGPDCNKITIPANTLRQNSHFLLKIATNLDGTEDNIKYKYIPFSTKYIQDDYEVPDIPTFSVSIDPTDLTISQRAVPYSLTVTASYPEFTYTLTSSDTDVVVVNDDYTIEGRNSGSAVITVTATAVIDGLTLTSTAETTVTVEIYDIDMPIKGYSCILFAPNSATDEMYSYWQTSLRTEDFEFPFSTDDSNTVKLETSDVYISKNLYGYVTLEIDFVYGSKAFTVYLSCRDIIHMGTVSGDPLPPYGGCIKFNITVTKDGYDPVVIPWLIAISPYNSIKLTSGNDTNYYIPQFSFSDTSKTKSGTSNGVITISPDSTVGTLDDRKMTTYEKMNTWNCKLKDKYMVKVLDATTTTRKSILYDIINNQTQVDVPYTRVYNVIDYGDIFTDGEEGTATLDDIIGVTEAGVTSSSVTDNPYILDDMESVTLVTMKLM